MSKKESSYSDAMARLKELVEEIENEELDVDKLAHRVKEANSLIEFCSNKLQTVSKEVEKLLAEDKD